eukprot:TRINITY_DN6367_c1_g1_i1.p1 TRINITY_DN6367_c1_g1~~TRINITY_DN6367_c1_g1_i1.p1  ORF type:complete len:847 (-),score=199.41 TRINITY_DN6367_c1_g1_i1:36-2576(-)
MSQANVVNDILAKKPKRRVEWVQKRLKEELAIQHRDSLYEVLTRKEGRAFTADVAGPDALRTYNAVLSAIDLFTSKQQKQLKAEGFILRKLHAQEQERTEKANSEAKASSDAKSKEAAAKARSPLIFPAASPRPAGSATRPAKESPPRRTNPPVRQSRSRSTRRSVPRQKARKGSPTQSSPKTNSRKSPAAQRSPARQKTTGNSNRSPERASKGNNRRSRSRSPLARAAPAPAAKSNEPARERSESPPDWIPKTPPDSPVKEPKKGTGQWTTVFDNRRPPPAEDRRSPPREERRQPEERRAPPAEARRSPPREERKQPEERKAPPAEARRSPPREERRQPEERRAPPAEDRRSPPREDRRTPLKERRSPPKEESRAPSEDSGPADAAKDMPPDKKVAKVNKTRGLHKKSSSSSSSSSPSPEYDAFAEVPEPPALASPSPEKEVAAKAVSASCEPSASSEDTARRAGGASVSGSTASVAPEVKDAGEPADDSKGQVVQGPTVFEASASSEPPQLSQPLPPSRIPPPPPPRRRPPRPPSSKVKPSQEAVTVQDEDEDGKRQPLMWRYVAPDGPEPLAIRAKPDVNGRLVDGALQPGEVFAVSREEKGENGILFLRLADGRGWVFDRKSGLGRKRRARPLCVPHKVSVLEDDGASMSEAPRLQARARSARKLGVATLDSLGSLAKLAKRKVRKRRTGVATDPYMVVETAGSRVKDDDDVIEVGSDNGSDESGGGPVNVAADDKDKDWEDLLEQKKKEMLKVQLEEKHREIQALRGKLSKIAAEESQQQPLRVEQEPRSSRVVFLSPSDGVNSAAGGDEKRRHLQAMLQARKRAVAQSSTPPRKVIPRYN